MNSATEINEPACVPNPRFFVGPIDHVVASQLALRGATVPVGAPANRRRRALCPWRGRPGRGRPCLQTAPAGSTAPLGAPEVRGVTGGQVGRLTRPLAGSCPAAMLAPFRRSAPFRRWPPSRARYHFSVWSSNGAGRPIGRSMARVRSKRARNVRQNCLVGGGCYSWTRGTALVERS